MPLDNRILEYRAVLAASAPSFILSRRFVAAESWTKATTEDGGRYLGMFREREPDLPAILAHPRLLILGEPGAGKSTIGKSIVQHVLVHGTQTQLAFVVPLKSYRGNIRGLFLQNIPAPVLDAQDLERVYVLDGIDEVPASQYDGFQQDLRDLLTNDPNARIVCTARQAFHAQHPEAFPEGLNTFHLLDFDDKDIRSFVIHYDVNPEAFLRAVYKVDCAGEIRNPFVLDVMLKQYRDRGSLNALRCDNVRYVVDQLIQSRPTFSNILQRRALRMLAVTCETAARNELTPEEALSVLREAIDFSQEKAELLLDELSHSILIHTVGGISFQMRSYGEYLAAEELHDKPLERLTELAFINNLPIDSWGNAITYLAEIDNRVRQYFIRRHPEWLIDVSPEAFEEDERTILTRQLLQNINSARLYLVSHETLSLRRLFRLLTPPVVADLRAQLTSVEPQEAANALVLLSLQKSPDIVPLALQLVTAHHGLRRGLLSGRRGWETSWRSLTDFRWIESRGGRSGCMTISMMLR